ncbi:MAG: EamA family transporter, partial [Nocardioidaceae bacterium]
LVGSTLGRTSLGTTPIIAGVFTVAAVVLAPSLLLYPLDWLGTGGGVAMVLYLAFPGTVLAYSLFNRGLGRVSPATAATLGLAEPVVAALLGVVVLDEHLSALGWVGAFVVLLGLLVMIRVSRPRSADVLRLTEAH